jgi:hypothetical protein
MSDPADKTEMTFSCSREEMPVRALALRVLCHEANEAGEDVSAVRGAAFSMQFEEARATAARWETIATPSALGPATPLTHLEKQYLAGNVKLYTPKQYRRLHRFGRLTSRGTHSRSTARCATASHGPPGRPADDDRPPRRRSPLGLIDVLRRLLRGGR